MIVKFDKYNEEIGFRIPGIDDKPSKEPVRKKLGYKFSTDTDEPIKIEEEEYDIPRRLKNRNSYMVSDVVEILTLIKKKCDAKTASIVDDIAEELGLTEYYEKIDEPIYKKSEGPSIRSYDVPEI